MKRDRGLIGSGSGAEDAPLSFAQQRLWLLDQLEPAPSAYNVSIVRRLHGPLRVEALRHALDELVARHEILRTTYTAVGDRPVPIVGTAAPADLTVVDLTDRPFTAAIADARRRARAASRQRFDLARGPLFRALLVEVSSEEAVLALTMHHIATDAWSESVLLGELGALYDAFCRGEAVPLDPLPIQYTDFARWQREWSAGDEFRTQLRYWLERLDHLPPVLELPTDRPRPSRRSGRGGSVAIELSPTLRTGLREVTRAGRATLYMTLLAAFQILLARYSGADDIAVGTPIANRTRAETDGVVGFFANTLVLRTDLSGDPTFMELLARVRKTAVEAFSNQDVPFERVVKELQPERTLSHTSLFQHMFAFQNAPARDLVIDGITVTEMPLESETAMFDLTLVLSENTDALVGWLEYATDLYDRSTAQRLVRHFQHLLEAIVSDPGAPISTLELIDKAERYRMVVEWNATESAYPDRCIHELFEEQARLRPDAIALTAGEVRLTYRDLDEQSNRLAHHLRAHGVTPDARVGVCLTRSGDAVIALLATLKAGGAYLPLDPEYPGERLRFMIDDGHVQIVITKAALCDGLVDDSEVHVVRLDADASRIAAMPSSSPTSEATPDHLALIVYTSGSTGAPKGVMIEHRSVVALLFGVDYIRFGEIGTMLHMAPLSFDAATFEIWGALLHGRHCVVYEDAHFSLERFGEIVRSEAVDTLWLTASLFNVIVDESWRSLCGIRQLIVGGEALSGAHVAKCLRLLPAIRLVNGYGPTEATTFAACHEISVDDIDRRTGSVPIGRPTANTELYILDAHRRPVPINVTGEIYIGGVGLARGYVGRPELTAESFVSHPFAPGAGARVYRTGDLARFSHDGAIEFVGRVDDQVKIRGYRVEPGELESVLREHPAVAAAVVVPRESESGSRGLVAYVVATNVARPLKRELLDYLRGRVPAYLLPTGFVWLDSLPLSHHGKFDRAALPAFDDPAGHAPYVAPNTPTEKVHAAIWREVLGMERVGIDDNFFDLGGDSLLAALLFARTARRTGNDLPLSLLFSGPTIREVARAVEHDDDREETSIVPLQPLGSKPPLIVGHGVGGLLFRYTRLLRRLDPEQPVYGLCPTDAIVGRGGRLRIEDLAERYVDELRRLRPEGPYCLAGFCFGGVLVIEVARQLEALGQPVALIVLFDAEPSSAARPSKPRREAAQLAALVRGQEPASAYFRRRVANVRIKVRRWPWLAEHWFHRRTGRPLPERWDDVPRVQALRAFPLQRSLSRALGVYVAPRIMCPVTTIRAGDATAPVIGIRSVAGADETYMVDGPGISHETLMDEPFVAEVANLLTMLLERAHGRTIDIRDP